MAGDSSAIRLSVNAQEIVSSLNSLDRMARGAAGGVSTMNAAFQAFNAQVGGMSVPTFRDFVDETDAAAGAVAYLQSEIEKANRLSHSNAGVRKERVAAFGGNKDRLERVGFNEDGGLRSGYRGRLPKGQNEHKTLPIEGELGPLMADLQERRDAMEGIGKAAEKIEKQEKAHEAWKGKNHKIQMERLKQRDKETGRTNQNIINSELRDAKKRLQDGDKLTRQQSDLMKAARKAHDARREMSGDMKGFFALEQKMHMDRRRMLEAAQKHSDEIEKARQVAIGVTNAKWTEAELDKTKAHSRAINERANDRKKAETQWVKDVQKRQRENVAAESKATNERLSNIRRRIRAGADLKKDDIDLIVNTKKLIKEGKELSAVQLKLASSMNLAGNKVEVMGNKVKLTNVKIESMRKTISQARNAVLVYSFALRPIVDGLRSVTSAAVEYERSTVGVTNVAAKFNIGSIEVRNNLDALTKDGLLKATDASKALRNLLSTGIGMPKAIELMKTFRNSAAFNRQGMLEYGEAIVGATDGFKNMISRMVDNAGITKNLSNILEEQAIIMDKKVSKMTEYEKHLAIANGLIKEGNIFHGDADKLTQTMSGNFDAMSVSIERANRSMGDLLDRSGLISYFTEGINKMALAIESLVSNESPFVKMQRDLGDLGFSSDDNLVKQLRLYEAQERMVNIKTLMKDMSNMEFDLFGTNQFTQTEWSDAKELGLNTLISKTKDMMANLPDLAFSDKESAKESKTAITERIKQIQDFRDGTQVLLQSEMDRAVSDQNGDKISRSVEQMSLVNSETRKQIDLLSQYLIQLERLADAKGFDIKQTEEKRKLTLSEREGVEKFIKVMERRMRGEVENQNPDQYEKRIDAEKRRFEEYERQIEAFKDLTEEQKKSLMVLHERDQAAAISQIHLNKEADALKDIMAIKEKISMMDARTEVDKYQRAKDVATEKRDQLLADLTNFKDHPMFEQMGKDLDNAFEAAIDRIDIEKAEDAGEAIALAFKKGLRETLSNMDDLQGDNRRDNRLEDAMKNVSGIGDLNGKYEPSEDALKRIKRITESPDIAPIFNDGRDPNKVKLYSNPDESKAMAPGVKFTIERPPGEILIHPITGESLGAPTINNGSGIVGKIGKRNSAAATLNDDRVLRPYQGGKSWTGDIARFDKKGAIEDILKRDKDKQVDPLAIFGGKEFVEKEKAAHEERLENIRSLSEKFFNDDPYMRNDQRQNAQAEFDERIVQEKIQFYKKMEDIGKENLSKMDQLDQIRNKVGTKGSSEERLEHIRVTVKKELSYLDDLLNKKLISEMEHQKLVNGIVAEAVEQRREIRLEGLNSMISNLDSIASGFSDIASAARFAGNKSAENLDLIAKKANLAVSAVSNIATGAGMMASGNPLGAFAVAQGALQGIEALRGPGKGAKEESKRNRNGDIGSTISRGPQTININPTIIVEAEGDVLFSQDSIEVFRNRLIDEVQQAVEFNELTIEGNF
jgi:hypothetical protein